MEKKEAKEDELCVSFGDAQSVPVLDIDYIIEDVTKQNRLILWKNPSKLPLLVKFTDERQLVTDTLKLETKLRLLVQQLLIRALKSMHFMNHMNKILMNVICQTRPTIIAKNEIYMKVIIKYGTDMKITDDQFIEAQASTIALFTSEQRHNTNIR